MSDPPIRRENDEFHSFRKAGVNPLKECLPAKTAPVESHGQNYLPKPIDIFPAGLFRWIAGKKDPLMQNSKTRMADVGIVKRDAEIGYRFEAMAEGRKGGCTQSTSTQKGPGSGPCG